MERKKKSFDYSKAAGNKRTIGHSLYDIGIVYMHKGNYEQAIKYLEQSVSGHGQAVAGVVFRKPLCRH